jgi:hypothetical protein
MMTIWHGKKTGAKWIDKRGKIGPMEGQLGKELLCEGTKQRGGMNEMIEHVTGKRVCDRRAD